MSMMNGRKRGKVSERQTSHLERLVRTEKDLGEKRSEIKGEKGRDTGWTLRDSGRRGRI